MWGRGPTQRKQSLKKKKKTFTNSDSLPEVVKSVNFTPLPHPSDTHKGPCTLVQHWHLNPMRPKTRGLTQNGGLPCWLEESDPAGVIFYVMDGPYH
jgi:hypothetical protein